MNPPSIVVVDLGGTHLRLGHLARGEVMDVSHQLSSDLLRGAEPVAALAGLVLRHVQEQELEPDAVVVGVPVSLAADLDLVLSSPNIPGLEGLRFGSALQAALGLPVLLERDTILHLQGEGVAGAGRGVDDLLGVYFGTGVGGAWLQGGWPRRGHPVSLEIGHIPVRAEGRRCVCGNTDCLEAYACGHVLERLSADAAIPLSDLFARRSESPALDARLGEFVRDQAYAVATAVNLLGPEMAVIGGGIPLMSGYPRGEFLSRVREHLRRPQPQGSVRLAWARLGWRAALHGARRTLEQRG